ncbi:MAG: glycyl-radical enzyme activating protein [Planctomycetota bacterium]
MTGRIFEIQRFSIHDGPGIRTTVFMKGCPLKCLWCHNPEGISREPMLSFMPEKCIGCGYCFRVCPQHAHGMSDGTHVLERELCRACGQCTTECYAEALELIGRDVTVDEVIDEVLRDKPFYETSGGGLTLSGGEPMMQVDFTEALLARARDEQLHTCMETCGFSSWDNYLRVLPMVDLFLVDVKDMDPARHREFTGVELAPIVQTIRKLHEAGKPLMLRLPIVPGYNDRDDHFVAVARLVKELPGLEGVEIMPYHRLGTSKVDRLGLDASTREQSSPPDDDMLRGWIDRFAELGVTLVNPRPQDTTE